MYWLLIYIKWMLYTLLAIGVLESASDRTVLGALSTVVSISGPLDPFASG
jgi:hypothetical protein